MRRRLIIAFAVVAVACSHELGEPRTRYLEPAIAATALTTAPGARLVPIGDGAALVSVTATEARWAVLGADGHLGVEASAPVPAHTLGPWVGLTTAATSGDRAVIVWGEPKADGSGAVRLVASVVGDAGAGATKVDLGEVAPALLASLRVSVASDPGGAGVAVALGFEGQPGTPVTLRVVRAGSAEATIGEVASLPPAWRCLSLVPSRTPFALSAASADAVDLSSDKTPVVVAELNGEARPVFIHHLSLTVTNPGCPVVGSTPDGYLLAMQTAAGTYLADYDVAARASPTNFVLGSVRFGGPSQQPPVGAAARLGRRNAVLVARREGPELWSFDRQGRIEGSPLRLPVGSPLAANAVTAASVAGELWVSYLDGSARRFLRLQSVGPAADVRSDGGGQ